MTPCSFKFEVRQNMLQISNSLQRERHFCFDANPYPTGRRGLRRNRNVWRATSSEISAKVLLFLNDWGGERIRRGMQPKRENQPTFFDLAVQQRGSAKRVLEKNKPRRRIVLFSVGGA